MDNYLPMVLKIAANFESGTAHVMHVRHDEWCAHLAGGSCNCDPDIEWEDVSQATKRAHLEESTLARQSAACTCRVLTPEHRLDLRSPGPTSEGC